MKGGLVSVPVYNLGRSSLSWTRFRRRRKKEEFDFMEKKKTGSIASIHQDQDADEVNKDYNLEDLKITEGLMNVE